MLEMRDPLNIPVDGHTSVNDFSNWRLKCTDGGRHTWHYISDEEARTWPQSTLDKYWLGLPTVRVVSVSRVSSRVNTSQGLPSLPQAKDAMSAARNGFTFYKHLQAPDGHWPGEYGGPLFLLPGLVIGSYVSGMDFTEAQRMGIIRYLINRAHPDDGGWGM